MINSFEIDSKLKQYITKQCDVAWKKATTKYGKSDKWELSKRLCNDAYNDGSFENDKMEGSKHLSSITHFYQYYRVGGYIVGLYSDSDHIDGVEACFQLKSKIKMEDGSYEYKILCITLPAPTKDEIKAMGYYKEGLISR